MLDAFKTDPGPAFAILGTAVIAGMLLAAMARRWWTAPVVHAIRRLEEAVKAGRRAAPLLAFALLASCGGGGGTAGDNRIDLYFQNDGSPSGVNAVGYVAHVPGQIADPLPEDYTWLDLSADPMALGERVFGFSVPQSINGYHLAMTTNAGGWFSVYTDVALADLVFVIDGLVGEHVEDPWTYPGGPPP